MFEFSSWGRWLQLQSHSYQNDNAGILKMFAKLMLRNNEQIEWKRLRSNS